MIAFAKVRVTTVGEQECTQSLQAFADGQLCSPMTLKGTPILLLEPHQAEFICTLPASKYAPGYDPNQ